MGRPGWSLRHAQIVPDTRVRRLPSFPRPLSLTSTTTQRETLPRDRDNIKQPCGSSNAFQTTNTMGFFFNNSTPAHETQRVSLITTIGSKLVENLKWMQASIAAITGFADAAPYDLDTAGNDVSHPCLSSDEKSFHATLEPMQVVAHTSNNTATPRVAESTRRRSAAEADDNHVSSAQWDLFVKLENKRKAAQRAAVYKERADWARKRAPELIVEARQRVQLQRFMKKKMGIKVRDFAYESTLPPVPFYLPPVPTGRQPLKRELYEPEEEVKNDSIIEQSIARVKRRRIAERAGLTSMPVGRARTGPVEHSQAAFPSEASSSTPMDVDEAPVASGSQSVQWSRIPSPATAPRRIAPLPHRASGAVHTPHSQSRRRGHLAAESQEASQEDDSLPTPGITPSGSLEFPVAHAHGVTLHSVAGPSRLLRKPTENANIPSHSQMLPALATPSQNLRVLPRRPLQRSYSRITIPSKTNRPPTRCPLQAAKSFVLQRGSPRRLATNSAPNLAGPPPAPRYGLRDRSPKSPVRARLTARATTSSSSSRQIGGKPRSSLSRSATAPKKAKAVPKPNKHQPTRRSARKAAQRA